MLLGFALHISQCFLGIYHDIIPISWLLILDIRMLRRNYHSIKSGNSRLISAHRFHARTFRKFMI